MNYFKCFVLILLSSVAALFAKQKVVLFNDTSAWYHWGCTGTSTALKEEIVKLGYEIKSFPINVTYSLKEVPKCEDFDDESKFNLFKEANPEIVSSINESDAVVITGEGTIHDMRQGPLNLLYVAHISKKWLHKHVEIINHSAYPKDDPELCQMFLKNFVHEKNEGKEELKKAEDLYRHVYSELDFVAIREKISLKTMKKISIDAVLSFDCLPLYIMHHYQKSKLKTKNLLLSGSVAYTEDGLDKICRYLELMEKKGFKIQVLIGAAAFPSKDDRAFVTYVREHCKASFEIIDATSMKEWLETIDHAALLVSGRFHHSIASFCLDTPFIALNSNTHKVHAIMDCMGQKEPLLYTDENLLKHLLQRSEEALKRPVKNQKKVEELCNLARMNFLGLHNLNQSAIKH